MDRTAPRKFYEREMKIEAVRRILVGREPVKAVADSIGIGKEHLYTWIYGYQKDPLNAFPGITGSRGSYQSKGKGSRMLDALMSKRNRYKIALLTVLGLLAVAGVCLSVF